MNFDVMRSLLLLTILGGLGGCTDAKMLRTPPPPEELIGDAEYRIGCPDVLQVTFVDHPEWDALASVDVDGRLPLGPAGRPHVDAQSLATAQTIIATTANVAPERVAVVLADPRTGRIYLSGPENGRQRMIPYRGPERVVEFLWRVGAIKQGTTDLHDVQVIRPNVAIGEPPTVMTVDLEAVLLNRNTESNVTLRASDQVIVGETRRSAFSRLLPDWFAPAYRKLVGMLPPDSWPW